MTRLLAALTVLGLTGIALSADLDADGTADCGYSLADADNDGCFDAGSPAQPGPLSDSVLFTRVWDSGTWLNNQWGATAGRFDDDSLLDILGMHFSPNQLHVFESDGTGGYRHVWNQTDSMPPGSYGALCAGDPDEDGRVELLGGDVSTLGRLILFENTGNDSWGQPRTICQTQTRFRAIRVADVNRNDTADIVLFCGSTDGGKVQVWEHSGAPGVHDYRLLYEYTTPSYLFNGEVGDADNDGYPELLLGIGGGHGYPMYIRRLVYDPGARTWTHHMYESPEVIGLALAPLVVDLDTNGIYELAVGSSGAPVGQVHVFKHTAGDTFDLTWTSPMTTSGNVISLGSGQVQAVGPVLFAAPFGGAVWGFAAGDTGFSQVSYFATSGPVRSITACRDSSGSTGCDQLVISENTSEQIAVWRAQPQSAIASTSGVHQSSFVIAPNPLRSGFLSVSFTSSLIPHSSSLSVYDPLGRRIRTFDIRASSSDIDLGSLPAGVYLVKLTSGSATATRKLVIER